MILIVFSLLAAGGGCVQYFRSLMDTKLVLTTIIAKLYRVLF